MISQCKWCRKEYEPRDSGGSPQKFCSKQCKRLFEKTILKWAYDEHAKGRINLFELESMHSFKGGCND